MLNSDDNNVNNNHAWRKLIHERLKFSNCSLCIYLRVEGFAQYFPSSLEIEIFFSSPSSPVMKLRLPSLKMFMKIRLEIELQWF